MAIGNAIFLPDAAFIADAIAVALDDLLAAGRTSSLDRWVTAARKAEVEGGVIDYAEAELRLRQGSFDQSLALGGRAGDTLAEILRPARISSRQGRRIWRTARHCGTTTSRSRASR